MQAILNNIQVFSKYKEHHDTSFHKINTSFTHEDTAP
jgi:hypothetical protein